MATGNQELVAKPLKGTKASVKNTVDAIRSGLISKVPLMLERLEALTCCSGEIGHNAFDRQALEAERIEVARQKIELGAITDWLDRAGIIPPKAQQERAGDLQLAEMTVGELRRLADTLDGEIAERAKVVNAPDSVPEDASGVDSLM